MIIALTCPRLHCLGIKLLTMHGHCRRVCVSGCRGLRGRHDLLYGFSRDYLVGLTAGGTSGPDTVQFCKTLFPCSHPAGLTDFPAIMF